MRDSKGGSLEKFRYGHTLIVLAVWFSFTIGLTLLLLRLMPRDYREIFRRTGGNLRGSLSVTQVLSLLVAFASAAVIGPAVASLLALSIALTVAWMTAVRLPALPPESTP
jgi:hypothetical protein